MRMTKIRALVRPIRKIDKRIIAFTFIIPVILKLEGVIRIIIIAILIITAIKVYGGRAYLKEDRQYYIPIAE